MTASLNEKKTQNIVFNFTKDHQFTSEISLKNEKLVTVKKTKLLGVIITDDLKWQENTKHIVKNANKKMRMLHKFSKFTKNKSHLMHIFKSQVRGSLEYCSSVWHSSLTESDCNDIERVQKAAMKVIMGTRYQGYEEALKFMKIDSLRQRRLKTALRFAKKSVRHVSFSSVFPLHKNDHSMMTRNPAKYVVKNSKTERMKRSAVPFLQRLLNEDNEKQKKDLISLLQVNNGVCNNAPITY